MTLKLDLDSPLMQADFIFSRATAAFQLLQQTDNPGAEG